MTPKIKSPLDNVSVYWIGLLCVAIYFLFIRTPYLLIQYKTLDVAFSLHLLGAYSIYMACIVNTLFTPSTMLCCSNQSVRELHIWSGRMGMMGGILAFLIGLYLSFAPWRGNPPLGFSIGITIGGIFQVYWQYKGYFAIQKYQELKKQISLLEEEEERMMTDSGPIAENATETGSEPQSKTQTADSDTAATAGGQSGSEPETKNEKSSTESDVVVSKEALLESMKEQKEVWLKRHIHYMVALYAVGCSTPAVLRICFFLPVPHLLALGIAFAVTIGIVVPFRNVYIGHNDSSNSAASLSSGEANGLSEPLVSE